MLLHLSQASEESHEYKGLLYTNPLLVNKLHSQYLINEQKKEMSESRQNFGVIPCMKTITINIDDEMKKEEMGEPIDLRNDANLSKMFGSKSLEEVK